MPNNSNVLPVKLSLSTKDSILKESVNPHIKKMRDNYWCLPAASKETNRLIREFYGELSRGKKGTSTHIEGEKIERILLPDQDAIENQLKAFLEQQGLNEDDFENLKTYYPGFGCLVIPLMDVCSLARGVPLVWQPSRNKIDIFKQDGQLYLSATCRSESVWSAEDREIVWPLPGGITAWYQMLPTKGFKLQQLTFSNRALRDLYMKGPDASGEVAINVTMESDKACCGESLVLLELDALFIKNNGRWQFNSRLIKSLRDSGVGKLALFSSETKLSKLEQFVCEKRGRFSAIEQLIRLGFEIVDISYAATPYQGALADNQRSYAGNFHHLEETIINLNENNEELEKKLKETEASLEKSIDGDTTHPLDYLLTQSQAIQKARNEGRQCLVLYSEESREKDKKITEIIGSHNIYKRAVTGDISKKDITASILQSPYFFDYLSKREEIDNRDEQAIIKGCFSNYVTEVKEKLTSLSTRYKQSEQLKSQLLQQFVKDKCDLASVEAFWNRESQKNGGLTNYKQLTTRFLAQTIRLNDKQQARVKRHGGDTMGLQSILALESVALPWWQRLWRYLSGQPTDAYRIVPPTEVRIIVDEWGSMNVNRLVDEWLEICATCDAVRDQYALEHTRPDLYTDTSAVLEGVERCRKSGDHQAIAYHDAEFLHRLPSRLLHMQVDLETLSSLDIDVDAIQNKLMASHDSNIKDNMRWLSVYMAKEVMNIGEKAKKYFQDQSVVVKQRNQTICENAKTDMEAGASRFNYMSSLRYVKCADLWEMFITKQYGSILCKYDQGNSNTNRQFIDSMEKCKIKMPTPDKAIAVDVVKISEVEKTLQKLIKSGNGISDEEASKDRDTILQDIKTKQLAITVEVIMARFKQLGIEDETQQYFLLSLLTQGHQGGALHHCVPKALNLMQYIAPMEGYVIRNGDTEFELEKVKSNLVQLKAKATLVAQSKTEQKDPIKLATIHYTIVIDLKQQTTQLQGRVSFHINNKVTALLNEHDSWQLLLSPSLSYQSKQTLSPMREDELQSLLISGQASSTETITSQLGSRSSSNVSLSSLAQKDGLLEQESDSGVCSDDSLNDTKGHSSLPSLSSPVTFLTPCRQEEESRASSLSTPAITCN